MSAQSLQPEESQPTADKSAPIGTHEDAVVNTTAAVGCHSDAATPTGPAQLLPPPFAGHTAENSNAPAAAALTRDPSGGMRHADGNVQISTEADALRAQAASQQQPHGGGLAAARAFGDRLLGAPLRDSSELVRSGLFSLVSTVARAPGAVLGRGSSAGSGAASRKTPDTQSQPATGGLVPAAGASEVRDAAVIGAASRPGSATAAAAAEPTAGLEAEPASSRDASTERQAIEVTVSATADSDRPVRIFMAVSSFAAEGPATGCAAAPGNSAAPQAAEAYRPAARGGFGSWLGRGGGGAPSSPPSAVLAAGEKPDSPPTAPAQRQPSLPSASARIGSFFRRGGSNAAPAADTNTKAGEFTQPFAAPKVAAATGEASGEEQANGQAAASIAAQNPPSTPASPAAVGASANGPSCERPIVSANASAEVHTAARSIPAASSALRGKLEPDERRKLRVGLQMAAQLRQVNPVVSPSQIFTC